MCRNGHLVYAECAAVRHLLQNSDGDVQATRPMATPAYQRTTRPSCRDPLVNPAEHLLFSQLGYIVLCDRPLDCGVFLDRQETQSGRHRPICGSRLVRCPVSWWNLHWRNDQMFRASEVAQVLQAHHGESPAFVANISVMKPELATAKNLPAAIPSMTSVAIMRPSDCEIDSRLKSSWIARTVC